MLYVGLGRFSDENHYKYDPFTNIWTQLNDAPSQYFSNTSPFVLNGKGYFPESFNDSLYEFDPVLDTWTNVGPMPGNVGHRNPSMVIGNKGYWARTYSFYEFDPATYTWTQKANFPGSTPHNPIGLTQYGYGYFVGGYLQWGESSDEVWRYDQNTDTWLQMENFPGTHRRWAVYAMIGERAFFGLGTSGTNMNDWWEFNSIGNTGEIDKDSFKVYPTLADQHVNFESEEHKNFAIEIYSMDGKSCSRAESVNGVVNLQRNGLPSGSYIYHIEIDGRKVLSDQFVFK